MVCARLRGRRSTHRLTPAAIYNYSADAGAGSHIITNISESPGWRGALLGTVAFGALCLYSARVARADPDPCTAVGVAPNQTATCQGNQSQGITSAGADDFDPAAVETLNVNSLNTNIAPAAGADGIYFHRTGAGNDVVINSNTGPFEIVVSGDGADGIDAQSDAGITIDHIGNIDASQGRYGIFAQVNAPGAGGISVISEGIVTGSQRGINARNYGTGALEIVANGDVTGTNGNGIHGLNFGTNLSIESQAVNSGGNAIYARNHFGALTVTAHGDLIADRIWCLCLQPLGQQRSQRYHSKHHCKMRWASRQELRERRDNHYRQR